MPVILQERWPLWTWCVIAFTLPTIQINGVRKNAIGTRLPIWVTKENNIKVIEGQLLKR